MESLQLFDDFCCLAYPIIFWRNRACAFTVSPGGPHRFGGPLPNGLAVPENAKLHSLLRIDVSKCEILSDLEIEELPLIFPFQHDGGQIGYKIGKNNGLELTRLEPSDASEDWPYEDYPRDLPLCHLECSVPFELGELSDDDLLNQWEIPSEHVGVVIPPRSDYGVSLWGEGDDEMVQCVFEFDPVTCEVKAANQAS